MKEDDVAALAEIQACILWARSTAMSTADPRKRDACLRVADAIEQRARALDAARTKPLYLRGAPRNKDLR